MNAYLLNLYRALTIAGLGALTAIGSGAIRSEKTVAQNLNYYSAPPGFSNSASGIPYFNCNTQGQCFGMSAGLLYPACNSQGYCVDPSAGAPQVVIPGNLHENARLIIHCIQVGTESNPNAPVGSGPGWYQGLDTNIDERNLGGKIKAYKIQWFNGIWSHWYTPGVNDIDWKRNYDGTQRRVWSYFTDRNHIYTICY
jgi:hypothetical protein